MEANLVRNFVTSVNVSKDSNVDKALRSLLLCYHEYFPEVGDEDKEDYCMEILRQDSGESGPPPAVELTTHYLLMESVLFWKCVEEFRHAQK